VTRSHALLAQVLQPVEAQMERVRAILGGELQDASPVVSDMLDHVSRFRGKELRAALVLLAGEATGNSTDEHAAIAAIVELIHLATLVHDDILDGAEVRRRVACVNQRWNNQVAVLLGDYLYARAFSLSTQLSSRLTSRVLAETTRTLCTGEIEQSAARYDFEMSQERYEGLCGAKTASLYAAACELGARYPGGNEKVGSRLRGVGWDLGLAFQIVDDCLDIVGTQEVVGKTVGCDVEDGKVTLPVLRVYSSASEDVKRRIRDIYTEPGLADRARVLRESIDLEPGLAFAHARARELVDGALSAVTELHESPARASIERICGFVLLRSF
jgi:octaprenyl-diphosphate synthase